MKNNYYKQVLLNLLLISACVVNGTKVTIPSSSDAKTGKQSVISTCHAVRAVSDHTGEASWVSDCKVDVWTGDQQPDLSFLNSDDRAKVLDGLAQRNPPTEPSYDVSERSKYLADEAASRHFMCMEARRTVLDQLKLLLPAGMTDCNRITEVMNNLKLSPELEAFIGHVNGPMKDLVARIHAIEQNSSTPEPEKREAIRVVKTDLTRLLDETCRDEHPSIRYNNISYLPNPAMEKVRMVLVLPHSGHSVHLFSTPENQLGPHVEYLRGMTEAAARHALITGNGGEMEATYRNGSGHHGSDSPGLISLVSKSSAVTEGKVKTTGAESTAKDSKKPVKSEDESNEENIRETDEKKVSIEESKTSEKGSDEPISPIDKFWTDVKTIKNFEHLTEDVGFKEALDELLTPDNLGKAENVKYDSTEKFWKKKIDDLNEDEKKIEAVYQKSKAILKDARIKKPKSLASNQVKQAYAAAKKIISDKREKDRQSLPLYEAISGLVDELKPEEGKKFDAGMAGSKIQNFLTDYMGLINERPDYFPSANKFWGKKFSDLDATEKAIEVKYQKQEELLRMVKQALKDAGLSTWGIFRTSIADQVYNIGKDIIDKERKTGNSGNVGRSSLFSFIG